MICSSPQHFDDCLLTSPLPLQVVLVANSLPAINDVTVAELRSVSMFEAVTMCRS